MGAEEKRRREETVIRTVGAGQREALYKLVHWTSIPDEAFAESES